MTLPYNGNPGPRPALRKAADADLHPVTTSAGEPARDPAALRGRIAVVPTSTEPSPLEGAADERPTATKEKAKNHKKGKKGKSRPEAAQRRMFQGATSDVMRHPEPRERDMLLGKQADLTVRIPKRLRKAARAQAERNGTTLDDVVTGLLAGWVDGS